MMVCPVCIVDGIVITACKFFGVPDVITAFLIGLLTAHLAILTHRWIKSREYKSNYYVVILLFTVVTLYTLKVAGMW